MATDANAQKELNKAKKAIQHAVRTGLPLHRLSADMRFLLVKSLGFTSMSWLTDCFDSNHPSYKVAHGIAGFDGDDYDLSYSLAHMIFEQNRIAEDSASPTWFSVSSGLALRLMTTELDGITALSLKLPFRGFYVELPPNVVSHELDGIDRDLRSVFVTDGTTIDGRIYGGEVAGRRLVVTCNHCWTVGDFFACRDLWADVLLHDDSKCVSEAMGVSEYIDHVPGTIFGVRAGADAMCRAIQRLAVNLILYLQLPTADVQLENLEEIERLRSAKIPSSPSLRKAHKERLRRAESARVWNVGSKIVVDKRLREAVAAGNVLANGCIRAPSLVRGHWRNQAHGPGHSLRRLTWIEPHVRGVDIGTVLGGNDYDVR